MIILDISLKWPSHHLVFEPPFTFKPLFLWHSQSKEILLNMGMKC
jgi:hypothetical protein